MWFSQRVSQKRLFTVQAFGSPVCDGWVDEGEPAKGMKE